MAMVGRVAVLLDGWDATERVASGLVGDNLAGGWRSSTRAVRVNSKVTTSLWVAEWKQLSFDCTETEGTLGKGRGP